MAKIDLAYSLEIHDIVDAMEANELWIEGVIKDKKAFECIQDLCEAKITCRNMDTLATERKMIPHFIYSSQENRHIVGCAAYVEYEEKENRRKGNSKGKEAENIGKKVCFHIVRPENHRCIEHKGVGAGSNDKETQKQNARKKYENGTKRISNYYWLNSLIAYYINSYKDGTVYKNTIDVDFGRGNIYHYKLGNFFRRISNETEITERDKGHYVYYGKGKVFKREDGGYDIVFAEKFSDSNKKIKCVVKKEILDACEYGKVNKISFIEKYKGKECFIYLFSSKKIDIEHEKVYLNISNLDCIAISQIDLDAIESEE